MLPLVAAYGIPADNLLMMPKGTLRAFLYLALTILAVPAWPQSQGAASDKQAREQGWKVFQQARHTFRAGGHPPEIKNYSFDLRTELHTPQGVSQIASRTFFQFPGYVRQEIETQRGPVVIVFDQDRGWQLNGTERKDLPKESVKQIQSELARNNVLIAPDPDPALVRYQGQEDVEGRKADVVQIADVGGTLLRLFVDTETHDVIRQMFVGDTPQGLAQVEETFTDFKEVDGYRWYQHRKVTRNGKDALESTRTQIRINTADPAKAN